MFCYYQLHYVVLNRFNVDTGAFFLPKAVRTCLFVAALHYFRLENGTFSTGFTTVKNHTEANVLVVWIPSSVECNTLLLQKGSNVFQENSQSYHI